MRFESRLPYGPSRTSGLNQYPRRSGLMGSPQGVPHSAASVKLRFALWQQDPMT